MQRMTQFPVILLNDLAVTWWRNQVTLTVKRIASLVNEAERCRKMWK